MTIEITFLAVLASRRRGAGRGLPCAGLVGLPDTIDLNYVCKMLIESAFCDL